MGLFARIKLLARLSSTPAEDSSQELGDLVEPGSVGVAAAPGLGSPGGAAGLDQLEQLRAAGLIDAETFALIEATMKNAGAVSGFAPSIDAAELELLQRGEAATATVLAPPEPTDGGSGRSRLRLEIHPADGPAYEAECAVAFAHPGGELKAGDFLQVKVDPAHREQVAIDWTGFGS